MISFRLGRLLGVGAGVLLLLSNRGQVPGQGPLSSRPIDFVKEIQPIFRNRCLTCHGPDKQRGDLRLDQREPGLRGGSSGPVIVPGKSAASLLLRRVSSRDKDERMPPRGERLTAEQIRRLQAWIDQGASWPQTIGEGPDPRKEHWAFRPVVRPPLPPIHALQWPRNPIDHFILARLEKEQLVPSREADRVTLLRRLKFNLLGLPPTPEEVAAFLADHHNDAYERLVDRLLASPHYGERWARHWLDVVRFAESDGFETNKHRADAWPYRDYVIRAFNEDRPYDRFVTEQLAGDTLGVDEATAFLVGGPVDRVKSPDIALTLQQRADELHDMLSTTGATFLGLTVGCARCHDHKFDPVSQQDYYGLKAVFAGVQHGERPFRMADHDQRPGQLAQLKQDLEAVERALTQLEARLPRSRLRPPVNRQRNDERFAPIEAKRVRFTIHATTQGEPCIDELEVFSADPEPVNVALASRGTRASASGTLPGHAIHKLAHINDGLYGNSWSWISNEPGKGWVQLEFPEMVTIDHIVWSRDRGEKGVYNDRIPTRYVIEVATAPGAWRVVATSQDRLPPGSTQAARPDLTALEPADREKFRELTARKSDLERRMKGLTTMPVVYAGKFTAAEPIYRLHRGDPLQKREIIAPAAPAGFGPSMRLPMDAPEAQRRLALARWITDPRNPLPARVLVNRLWHYHFGQGLVATPSDVGRNGGRPSHPELLDWLADEFIRSGWSIKHVQRLLVLSSTYRQASTANPKGQAADAGTHLLWRFPPRRLEAEPLRDAILCVSGKLDWRMGGPGFDLFEPNANYVKVYNSKKTFGPAEWRRMIYQSKPRMQLDDTFGAFDCPDAGQIAPRRTRSTTALQALNLLNSSFMVQQARFFAERLEREAGKDVGEQVRLGFRLAFSRAPSVEEQTAAVVLLREHGLMMFCRALFNANEFLYVF